MGLYTRRVEMKMKPPELSSYEHWWRCVLPIWKHASRAGRRAQWQEGLPGICGSLSSTPSIEEKEKCNKQRLHKQVHYSK